LEGGNGGILNPPRVDGNRKRKPHTEGEKKEESLNRVQTSRIYKGHDTGTSKGLLGEGSLVGRVEKKRYTQPKPKPPYMGGSEKERVGGLPYGFKIYLSIKERKSSK